MNRGRMYFYYRGIKWKLLRDRSPISAAIKVTQRCNLRCKHCAWPEIPQDLSTQQWKKIIDNLYRQGVITIVIEGGEPTLRKDIAELIDYINSKGINSILITNGIKDISKLNPDYFWISLDGMEKSNDHIRGRGVFRRVANTIEENQHKRIMTLTSISRTNVDDIESICEYFSDRVYGIWFHFSYPYKGIKEEVLNKNERMKVARQLMQLKKKYPKILNTNAYLNSVGKDSKCYPWLIVSLTADGRQLRGCMVEHIEEKDCSKCDMGCYAELSRVYDLNRESMKFWTNHFGIPRLF